MNFGFYLPCYWRDMAYPADRMYADMVDQAVLAEQIGMKTIWIPEHHFMNLLVHPNPLLTGIKVAAATNSIRIGTSVLVLPFFDMRRLAGEIAQADNLMDGRLELGVGRGAFKYEFDRFGLKVEDSRSDFDEALSLLERLLTETNVSSDTANYQFESLTITPRPLQAPMPPVWIAAVNPEAIYHTARKGYDVMTTPLRSPFEDARNQAEAFFRGKAENPRKGGSQRLSMLRMFYVTESRDDVLEKVAFAAENDQYHHNLRTSDGEVRNGKLVGHETGRTHQEIEDALIIGTPAQCIEKLNAYSELGIDELILNMGFGASHADVMQSLELFAEKVMPFVRNPSKVKNVQ
jgi:alkanesulfonate monooxygenase SsuD/methylene tetrahydromethanopterin reductase-like flavin-dependent oxidoreductase (luciferase family)